MLLSQTEYCKSECTSEHVINKKELHTSCINVTFSVLTSSGLLWQKATWYVNQMETWHTYCTAVSWRPLYQGFPNADSDPEPGRCRRTDGKKWRCSKEAMADHKYCERHINRNRHRSRKPVENQSRKTVKETPCAGSLPSSVGQGSFKKAKVNEMKPRSISHWTDSLNRLIHP